MKRAIMGILLGVAILSQPITVSANSQALLPTYDVEGIPPEIQQIAEVVGFEFNICPELLMSIAYQESRCTEDATNGSCMGLMQVNCSIHKDRFEEAGWSTSDWDNAYINMYVAGEYLAELFEKYEDPSTVLAVYHGEHDAVARSKTGYMSTYTREILERSEKLERYHGK